MFWTDTSPGSSVSPRSPAEGPGRLVDCWKWYSRPAHTHGEEQLGSPAAVQLWLSTVQKLVLARLVLLRFLQGPQLPVAAQQLRSRQPA